MSTIISCISSVDSSLNLLFSSISLLLKLGFQQKFYTEQHLPVIHFHIRSNAGIMAGNQDSVNH